MTSRQATIPAAAEIPPAISDQHIAVIGKTGSGKTYAAKGLVESWLDQSRQVCIIDPTARPGVPEASTPAPGPSENPVPTRTHPRMGRSRSPALRAPDGHTAKTDQKGELGFMRP